MLGRADAAEERVDLGTQLFGGAAKLERRTQHLFGGSAGLTGALADAHDVARDIARATRSCLGVPRNFLRRDALLLYRRGNRAGNLADMPDGLPDALDRIDRALCRLLDGGDLAGNVFSRFARLCRERLYFRGDHGEAFAGAAGARPLDGGVEREEIRLRGNVVDELDHLADALGGIGKALHGGVSMTRLVYRLARHFAGAGHLSANFRDRGQKLLGCGRDGLDIA